MSWKQGEIKQAENKTFTGSFATGSGFDLTFGIYKGQSIDFILLSKEEWMESDLNATHNVTEGAGGYRVLVYVPGEDNLKCCSQIEWVQFFSKA